MDVAGIHGKWERTGRSMNDIFQSRVIHDVTQLQFEKIQIDYIDSHPAGARIFR